ncbi:MAG: copper resistance CopC family protein [Cellulomonadaceae bacterium]
MPRPHALAAGVLVAAAALLATPLPASAHDQLVSSDPESGQHLDAAPHEVSLEFSGELLVLDGSGLGATVLVVDGEGRDWATGDPVVRERTVTVTLAPEMPDAGYEVRWQVVSSDGHPISGLVPFAVGDAEPLGSAATPVDPDSDSTSQNDSRTRNDSRPHGQGSTSFLRVALIGAGGGALALAALRLALRLRRPRAGGPGARPCARRPAL